MLAEARRAAFTPKLITVLREGYTAERFRRDPNAVDMRLCKLGRGFHDFRPPTQG